MRRVALLSLIAVATLLAARLTSAAERKPNLVLIFTDDQGYQDVGCYGSPEIRTPHLDRMAAEGVRFKSFYSASPVCSASRAALMTGSYPLRVGITGVLFPKARNGLNPDEWTIAEVLKQRGYATACVGKWHLGHHPKFLPTSQGFDSYYGIPYSNDMRIARDGKSGPPVLRNEEIVEHPANQALLTQRYTEESIRFIRANKDRPFFLYLPHTMPHVPLFASERFQGKSKRGLYGDTIEEIDWSVGEILKTLRELEIDDNTLVLFTSDNGPWLGKKRAGGSALPLRGGKFQTFEGGMRVPCIARWPGHIPAGNLVTEIGATIDILPTFAKLAGAPLPSDRVIDGRDLSQILLGKPGASPPHDAYFFYRGQRLEAVRSGPWKLHLASTPAARKKDARGKKSGRKAALYNLEADISESKNVIDNHPEIAERLRRAAENFDRELRNAKRPAGKL